MRLQVFAVLFAVLSIACTGEASAQAAPGSDGNRAHPGATPQQFVEPGFPPLDRPWTAADYGAAIAVYRRLGRDQFPSSNSPSAAVLDRVTNLENLASLSDRSSPVDQRVLASIDIMDAANSLLKMYYAAQQDTPELADDTLAILGFLLYAARAQLNVVDEFVLGLDPNDPTYETRMAGLERMQVGLAQMFSGALNTLQDSHSFSLDSRTRLAEAIAATYPAMSGRLPESLRTQLDAMLQTLAEHSSATSIRRALSRI